MRRGGDGGWRAARRGGAQAAAAARVRDAGARVPPRVQHYKLAKLPVTNIIK